MTNTPSLFDRLGGADAIASISSDLVERHRVNPIIGTRFADIDVQALKDHVTQFFIMGSGGPADYRGRDMPTAHKGMNCNERELVAALDDVMASLDAHEVDPVSRNEVLAILYSLKDEVLFK